MAGAEMSFFHYTSIEGLEDILESGFIQESTDRVNDAAFGEGVYGTSLPPSVGQKEIAQNNWGPFWKQNEDAGKVERAIELRIPEEHIQPVPSDRNILVHSGPINLDDHDHTIWNLNSCDDDKDHRELADDDDDDDDCQQYNDDEEEE